jgi:hypothetical protein
LYIPLHLQIIDAISFSRSSIIDVKVDPENQWFSMVDSYLITFVTHSMVYFFSGDSSPVISSTIQELGSHVFAWRDSLTTITFELPSIVVRFLDYAFLCCFSLESISIPTSVRFIGGWCFFQCKALVSVTFEQPSTLEMI